MVLQQNTRASVYGWSFVAQSTVSVVFQDITYDTISSDSKASYGGYFWKVSLPPTTGSFAAYTLNISSSAGERAYLRNIKFGDVFVCSGQSNMQLGVPDMFNATDEIKDADNYADIRLMYVYQDSCTPQVTSPLDDLYNTHPWSEASSDTVNASWEVSGVCWMYAKHLFNDIIKRAHPLGLVISDWGGTTIMAWGPQSVTDKCVPSASNSLLTDEKINADATPHEPIGDCMFNANEVAALYNTMIAPFKDMSVRAALWYQGESDSYQGQYYSCLQDGMVRAWRNLWGVDLPFMFTQLSTWDAGGGTTLANFRMIQESILEITEKTAMITAADLGGE